MTSQKDGDQGSGEKLPYRIELYDGAEPQLLGMALNAGLARAIYTTAMADYPNRHIVIRLGDSVVADSRRVSETS